MLRSLLHADDSWSKRLSIAEQPGPLRSAAAFFAHSGDSWFWGLGLAAVWATGNDFWKSWAVLLILSIVVTALIVMLIKVAVRRRRPEGEWGAIYRRSDPHSFPSGHAARAVMLAVLIGQWGPAWLGPVMMVWAPLVILARVALGLHYLSDMLAGAVLGGSVAIGVLSLI